VTDWEEKQYLRLTIYDRRLETIDENKGCTSAPHEYFQSSIVNRQSSIGLAASHQRKYVDDVSLHKGGGLVYTVII
jgi:hypothetical protein